MIYMSKFELNPDRFFDAEPAVRKIAAELYNAVRDLPIVSPHGHVDPAILAENTTFPDPAELTLIPDHTSSGCFILREYLWKTLVFLQ